MVLQEAEEAPEMMIKMAALLMGPILVVALLMEISPEMIITMEALLTEPTPYKFHFSKRRYLNGYYY